jgi:two-component system chemotaxis response regulator CheB
MFALPPGFEASADEQVTGLGCPDCPGALSVRVEGARGHLHFRCRIGHAYSLEELLLAKEREIEDRLFAVIVVFEEMAALLGDLDAAAGSQSWADLGPAFRDRAARARTLASRVRDIAEGDRPTRLDDYLVRATEWGGA